MRRPLKPFVTEYKSPTRRSKDMVENLQSSGLGLNDVFSDTGQSSRHAPPSAEDGYEAALRAADALFSSPSSTKRVPILPGSGDQPWSSFDAEPSHPAPDGPALFAQPSASPSPERASGRILQAIEAAIVDPFAALEAERAPKRRGRKPGSKNKPKVPLAAQEIFIDIEEPDIEDADDEIVPDAIAVPVPARSRPEPKASAARAASAPTSGRSGERFAWVRTTLRPGEKWKRRLPKVAW